MRRCALVVSLAAAVWWPASAWAQAWTPAQGSGSVSVSAQSVDHTGHIITDGTYQDNGRSRTAAVFADLEYGISRRLALGFSVPFVWARYTDPLPPPAGLPFLPVDTCRCWHSDWQDFGFTARFKLVDSFDHIIVVTPVVAVGAPSHQYAYQGEAVVGRRLNEVRVGADGSYRLDRISPNLTVNARYTYAFVEKVTDISHNRSDLNAAADYRWGRDWSVGGFFAWQRTHGGLRGTEITPEQLPEHDRLFRDNYTHLGAEASYRVGPANLFVAYTYFATGTDTHAGHAITGGMTLPFHFGR